MFILNTDNEDGFGELKSLLISLGVNFKTEETYSRHGGHTSDIRDLQLIDSHEEFIAGTIEVAEMPTDDLFISTIIVYIDCLSKAAKERFLLTYIEFCNSDPKIARLLELL